MFSALPSNLDIARRSRHVSNGSMLSKKSFGGIYENCLKLLMRSMRGDVRDHIAFQKNDHGLSYRHYKASQRRSSPKITICEIFGVVRFSTFSTASAKCRLCCFQPLIDFCA
jgi:hypothetical protein